MLFSKIKKSFLGKKEKAEAKQFLALEIGEDLVKAAVWSINGTVDVRAVFKGETVGDVLFQVREKNHQASEAVFGLPWYYLSGDEIKEKYLTELKKITKDNSLAPLGFVVVSEAVAHLLKVQEEAPQSAILIAVRKKELLISLFRGGKAKQVEKVERKEKLFDDLEKGLAEFSEEEVLPSKIILYDAKEDLEFVRDELLAYPWQRNSKFLHVPKIIALPWDFSIKAIVEAGVSEMKKKDVKMMVGPAGPAVFVTEEEKAEDDSLGFVEEKDVAEEEKTTVESRFSADKKGDEKTTAGKDVELEPVEAEESDQTAKEEGIQERAEEKRPQFQTSKPSVKFEAKTKLFAVFSRLRLPKMNFSFLKAGGALTTVLLLLIFGAVFISSLYFYPKAEIKLIAEPKVVDQQMDISLNTAIASADLENKEIPGKVYSTEVSGEKTKETTGKKTIGEKAKGEVTIYNKTSASKIFAKGTQLAGPSALQFALDSEVQIASASDTGISLEYGKADVKVTAVKIGPDGNLKEDSEFQVDDFPASSYAGRNNADFSGGTEREIDIVSKNDQESLLKELVSELRDAAKERLQLEVDGDERLLNESIKENIVDKTFDKDIGDESDNLSLSLTIEFSATIYKQSDLDQFLEQYTSDQVPSGFVFDKDKSYFNVTETKIEEDGSVTFSADHHAYLAPTIDLETFKKEIAGKSISSFEEKARELADKSIVGYEINYSRRFPLLGNRLPLLSQNIEVKIVPY